MFQRREGEDSIEHIQSLLPVLAPEVLWSDYSVAGVLTVNTHGTVGVLSYSTF